MDLERLKKALMPERLGDDHEESNVCRQCATFPARRAIEKGIFRNRIPEMGGRLESSGCALLVRGRASRAGARHRLLGSPARQRSKRGQIEPLPAVALCLALAHRHVRLLWPPEINLQDCAAQVTFGPGFP